MISRLIDFKSKYNCTVDLVEDINNRLAVERFTFIPYLQLQADFGVLLFPVSSKLVDLRVQIVYESYPMGQIHAAVKTLDFSEWVDWLEEAGI